MERKALRRAAVIRTVFLAGASGAIGRRLAPLLISDGWRVCGTTRTTTKAESLRELGVEPIVLDIFDKAAVIAAVLEARPDVVIHQLTDLPPALDPARMAEAAPRNARIRDEGTRNLVAAAVNACSPRFIAQSVAFAYAEKALPYEEGDALAVTAEGRAGVSARGVASLETQVLGAPFTGIVLRYGRLYGPGTGFDTPPGSAAVHVDAAAKAAAQAARMGESGIYNVAEDDGTLITDKAQKALAWQSAWRMS
jgi:nucleoside-diphosphate-sugar epimerase